MLALVVPIIYEIRFILGIWLGNAVPDETALFAVIVLMTYTWRTFHIAALMPYHAIGKIKTGNITIGTLMIATLPMGYVLFKFGCPAYSVFLAIFAVEIVGMFAIYWLIHRYEYFPYKYVFTKILMPCGLVTIFTIIVPAFITHLMSDGWLRFIIVGVTTEFSLIMSALYLGLNKEERTRIFSFIKIKLAHQ